MGRIIGIRHRRKRTAQGEERPTQVVILEEGESRQFILPDDTAELDFCLGRFPTSWRKLKEGEDPPEIFPPHHRQTDREGNIVKVPAGYDGLSQGDKVAMVLGGSGDRFAYALSRRADLIGAQVLRLPPFVLAERRKGEKEADAAELARLAKEKPELFYSTGPRDRNLIRIRECYRSLIEAMKARIACEQRLYQAAVGRIFCSEEGLYPEGSIELAFDQLKADDKILGALVAEEKERERELTKALARLDVYTEMFEKVEGVGPRIAARLIANIIDIRRFSTPSRLKAFCGVHLGGGGEFMRRRGGQVANWSDDCRKALFLLTDQFFKRPNSEWGRKLRENMVKFRERHPGVLCKVHDRALEACKAGRARGCKMRYNDLHIRKMAMWRTATQFVVWLWKNWTELERCKRGEASAA